MIKKLILFVVIFMLGLPVVGAAFESMSAVGVAAITQKGEATAGGYYIGFGIPIITKAESGFLFKNETTYLYADQKEQELQVIRVLLLFEKTIYVNLDNSFAWHIGFGSGTWSFTKVGTEVNLEKNDEMFGAFNLRTGINWSGVIFDLQTDIVQVPGSDLVVPSAGLSISF